MNVLHISYEAPYPIRNGYSLRVWHLCRNLSKKINLTLLFRVKQTIKQEEIEFYRNENIDAQAVQIPRPGLVKKLIKATSAASRGNPIGMEGYYYKKLRDFTLKLILDKKIDAVTLEGSWLGGYMPMLMSLPVIKVVDMHNIEAELLKRNAEIENFFLKKMFFYYDSFKMQRIERSFIQSADLIMTISRRELEILQKIKGKSKVVVVPNGADCNGIAPLPLTLSKIILFAGALSYFPNVDGIKFFVDQVYPSIVEADSEVKLSIVGKSPANSILSLNGYAGISIYPDVDDMTSYYEACQIVVVPLRSGGGTRLKILEAMSYGRPIVATSIGCEGIDVTDGKHLLIRDDPEDMKDAIQTLLHSPGQCLELVKNARQLVEDRYNWEKIANDVLYQYKQLQEEKYEKIRNR